MSKVCPNCNGPLTSNGSCADGCGWMSARERHNMKKSSRPSKLWYIKQSIPGVCFLALTLAWMFAVSTPPLSTKDLGRVDEDTISLVDERQKGYDERSSE